MPMAKPYKRDAAFAEHLQFVIRSVAKDKAKAEHCENLLIAKYGVQSYYAKWVVRQAAFEVAAELISQARQPTEIINYLCDGWSVKRRRAQAIMSEGYRILSERLDAMDPYPVCHATLLRVIADKDSSHEARIRAAKELLLLSPRYQQMARSNTPSVNVNIGGVNVVQALIKQIEGGAETTVVDANYIEQKVAAAIGDSGVSDALVDEFQGVQVDE